MTDPDRSLQEAEARDPGNPWVATLKDFYEKNGYLSDKQLTSLDNVRPSKKAPVEIVIEGNIDSKFPHMRTSLESLSEYNVKNRRGNGLKAKFNLIADIANGIIRPSLADLCEFEEEEERRHEGEREWQDSLYGYDIGDYESSLDLSDFH